MANESHQSKKIFSKDNSPNLCEIDETTHGKRASVTPEVKLENSHHVRSMQVRTRKFPYISSMLLSKFYKISFVSS